jgi:hypothetical protein
MELLRVRDEDLDGVVVADDGHIRVVFADDAVEELKGPGIAAGRTQEWSVGGRHMQDG